MPSPFLLLQKHIKSFFLLFVYILDTAKQGKFSKIKTPRIPTGCFLFEKLILFFYINNYKKFLSDNQMIINL